MLLDELYQEEPGSSFENDGKEYDINIVFQHMDSKPYSYYKVSDLEWVLKYDTPDPDRVRDADLDVPLLIGYYYNQFVVLDGLHRLTKAVNEGVKFLKGKFVDDDILKIALKGE